jgi:hypothetical protein
MKGVYYLFIWTLVDSRYHKYAPRASRNKHHTEHCTRARERERWRSLVVLVAAAAGWPLILLQLRGGGGRSRSGRRQVQGSEAAAKQADRRTTCGGFPLAPCVFCTLAMATTTGQSCGRWRCRSSVPIRMHESGCCIESGFGCTITTAPLLMCLLWLIISCFQLAGKWRSMVWAWLKHTHIGTARARLYRPHLPYQ